MIRNKISNFTLALAAASTILAGLPATVFSEDDLLNRTTGNRQCRHEGIIPVVIGVGAQWRSRQR